MAAMVPIAVASTMAMTAISVEFHSAVSAGPLRNNSPYHLRDTPSKGSVRKRPCWKEKAIRVKIGT